MKRIRLVLFSALIALAPGTGAEGRGRDAESPASAVTPQALEVPFVPQTGALCGGAALAMVLRYWGETGVLAEDFASRLEPDGSGIRADSLVAAARVRGWIARPVHASSARLRSELAMGRPVIVLLGEGGGAGHFVVVVGWSGGRVLTHDPSVGPWQTTDVRRFLADWSARDCWALIVLPPPSRLVEPPPSPAPPPLAAEESTPSRGSGCDTLVADGVRRAHAGDVAGAEHTLQEAGRLCPESAAPVRELAGLRFNAGDWSGAARLAERAIALEDTDSLAWRILAGSRFLGGDTRGALAAWNRVEEPISDLVRIDGLRRTRYGSVARQLDLPPRRVLTSESFGRARRRLSAVPALSASRLTLTPRPEGVVTIDVALVERPLLFDGPVDAGVTAVRSVIRNEVAFELAGPAGLGELWSAEYRWSRHRPRLRVGLAVPASGIRTGVWSVEGVWERETHAVGQYTEAGSVAAGTRQERRHRVSLALDEWVRTDLRVGARAAFDRWRDLGDFLAIEARVEARGAGDQFRVEAAVSGWSGSGRARPFQSADLLLRWLPDGLPRGAWSSRAGATVVSAAAPRLLWPGAGTGLSRPALLRAHPLMRAGILDGPVFGRMLLHAGLERVGWIRTAGPLRPGWAIFVDVARAWQTRDVVSEHWNADVGIGFRLAGVGRPGRLRLDMARGLRDGALAVSLAWDAS